MKNFRQRKKRIRLFFGGIICLVGLVLSTTTLSPTTAVPVVHAASVSIDDAPAGGIALPDNDCDNPIIRTFNVTQNFTVGDISLGLNVDHVFRTDVEVTLIAPDGTSALILDDRSNNNDNYDLMLTLTSLPSDDGNNDNTAAPLYDRNGRSYGNAIATFIGVNSQGTWTMEICDDGVADLGTYNSSQLNLTDVANPNWTPIANCLGGKTALLNGDVPGSGEATILHNNTGELRDHNAPACLSINGEPGKWSFCLDISKVVCSAYTSDEPIDADNTVHIYTQTGSRPDVTPLMRARIAWLLDNIHNTLDINDETDRDDTQDAIWGVIGQTSCNSLCNQAKAAVTSVPATADLTLTNQTGASVPAGDVIVFQLTTNNSPVDISLSDAGAAPFLCDASGNPTSQAGVSVTSTTFTDTGISGTESYFLCLSRSAAANVDFSVSYIDGGSLSIWHADDSECQDFLDSGSTLSASASGEWLQQAVDWGDLPDSTTTPTGSFPTRNTDSGPNHAISSNLYLGSCVDADSDGQPDYQAGTDGSGGDDNDGSAAAAGSCSPTGDDEDGVTLATPLIAGAQACVAVTAVNTTGGAANLYGWIDFNGNGAFEAGEALTGGSGGTGGNFSGGVASVANNTSGSKTYCFQVPANATFSGGETHMRFRLTTDTLSGGTPWGGSASNGEVEDYYSQLACVGNYLWMDTGSVANTQDGSDTAVANGTAVNLIWGGPDGLISTAGDNVPYSTTTGAGGIYSFCGVRPDANGDTALDQYQVIVPTSPGTPVTPNVGSVAQDSNGTANGNASESNVFTVPVPNGVVDNAPNDSNPNGYPGSQTDLSIDFGFQPPVYDFGDAPDGADGYPNQTVLANGARHLLNSELVLGTCVDSEADGSPVTAGQKAENPNPNTDDLKFGTASPYLPTPAACDQVDDEDGFVGVNDSDWSDNSGSLNVQVTGVADVGGSACVYGWIDFDQDGFDTGDVKSTMLFTSDGTQEMVFDSTAVVGSIPTGQPIYVRLRVVPGACGSLDPTGPVTGGEVEDHDINSATATAVNLGEITTRMPIANLVWVIAAALVLLTGFAIRVRRRPNQADATLK